MIAQQMPDFWQVLSKANAKRNALWDPKSQLDVSFCLFEMLGEMGEWANKIKKLERERLGIPGSRTTREEMLAELGDWIITQSLLFNQLGITSKEINHAVAASFNKKSFQMGFPVFINAGGEIEEEHNEER